MVNSFFKNSWVLSLDVLDITGHSLDYLNEYCTMLVYADLFIYILPFSY